jgi:hypothetical protein
VKKGKEKKEKKERERKILNKNEEEGIEGSEIVKERMP